VSRSNYYWPLCEDEDDLEVAEEDVKELRNMYVGVDALMVATMMDDKTKPINFLIL